MSTSGKKKEPLTLDDLSTLESESWIDKKWASEIGGLYRINSAESAQYLERDDSRYWKEEKFDDAGRKTAVVSHNGNYAGIAIPYWIPDSPHEYSQLRIRRDYPDKETKRGKQKDVGKYLTKSKSVNRLYFIRGTSHADLQNTSLPVFIVEGEKKGLALARLLRESNQPGIAIAISGVWNWLTKISKDGQQLEKSIPIPDLNLIEWHDRAITIIFDSNVTTQKAVSDARKALTEELVLRGARVHWVDIPADCGLNGIDNLLASWGPIRVLKLIEQSRPAERETRSRTFSLLTAQELLNLPELQWQIFSVLPAGGFCVLYGQSGVGKTFVAIDLALSIATGVAWQNKQVHAGPVVYVAAEGSAGMAQRMRAWLMWNKKGVPQSLYFLTVPAKMMEGEHAAELVKTIQERIQKPALVVLDTMARCLVGGDENSAKDVGLFIAGCDLVRAHTGAAVLLVHHMGKSGNIERGSSALRGAADVMIAVTSGDSEEGYKNRTIKISCDKQKDAEPFSPIHVKLYPLPSVASCVLTTVEYQPVSTKDAKGTERAILKSLSENFADNDGATWAQLLKSCGVSKASFNRSLKPLLENLHIIRKQSRYFITIDGKAVIAASNPGSLKVSNKSHETNETRTNTSLTGLTGISLDTCETNRDYVETKTKPAPDWPALDKAFHAAKVNPTKPVTGMDLAQYDEIWESLDSIEDYTNKKPVS